MQTPATSFDTSLKFSRNNISLSDFEQIKNPKKENKDYTILGRGNFAYTEKMRYKYDNEDIVYAIKKLDISQLEEKKLEKLYLKREIKLMSRLSHENIVRFYGNFFAEEDINKLKEIYKDKNKFQSDKNNKKIVCLVLEYLPNGNLEEFVTDFAKNNENENIPQSFVIKVFREILSGLIYLKSKKILHRDIKPANILFDKNYTAKITDFGLAALSREKGEETEEDDENEINDKKNNMDETDEDLYMNNSFAGDKNFVSYEVTRRKKYDYQTDVYSLGVTMFYMMTGSLPCYTRVQTNSEKKQYIMRKRNFNTINNYYHYDLRNLIEKMLNNSPKKRPTIAQVYEELMKIEYPLKNSGDTLADFEGINKIKMYKKNYMLYYVEKYTNNAMKTNPLFQKSLYKQNKILKNLSHKNIIKYYGFLEENLMTNNPPGIKDYYLIYDYIPNGSLATLIENNIKERFPEDFIIKIFKQILTGINYLHNENIAHGNLSPKTILFDSNYNIKITGFNVFGLYEEKHYTKDIVKDNKLFINNHYIYVGRFNSPEMIKGLDWNDKADIYSLGLIIICLLSHPLKFQKFIEENGNGAREIYFNNINQMYNQNLVSLVSKMVKDNPEQRPSANEVYDELILIEKQLYNNKLNNNFNQNINPTPMGYDINNFNCFPQNNNNINNFIYNNWNNNMAVNNINTINNNNNFINFGNNNGQINNMNNNLIYNGIYNNVPNNNINNNIYNNTQYNNNMGFINNMMPNNNYNNINYNNQNMIYNANMNAFNGINNMNNVNNIMNMNLMNNNMMNNNPGYFMNANIYNNMNQNNYNNNDIVFVNNINNNNNILNQMNNQGNYNLLPTYVERKNNSQDLEIDYLSGEQKPEEGMQVIDNPDYLKYLNTLQTDYMIDNPYLS